MTVALFSRKLARRFEGRHKPSSPAQGPVLGSANADDGRRSPTSEDQRSGGLV